MNHARNPTRNAVRIRVVRVIQAILAIPVTLVIHLPPAYRQSVLGADVDFVDGEDLTTQLFVPGDSLAEVSANAAQMLFGGEGWEDFQIVSPLGCGMSPQ